MYPSTRPIAIVAPERETPGTRASDCAKPYAKPCLGIRDERSRSLFPNLSAIPRIMPKTIITIAMSQRDLNVFRIFSWKRYPRITMGRDPTMIIQPRRTSCGELPGISLRITTLDSQAAAIRKISFLKYMSTASSVPICVIAVKVAPGSLALGKNSPARRRCALEEIGRNSVRPCSNPRKRASNMAEVSHPHR